MDPSNSQPLSACVVPASSGVPRVTARERYQPVDDRVLQGTSLLLVRAMVNALRELGVSSEPLATLQRMDAPPVAVVPRAEFLHALWLLRMRVRDPELGFRIGRAIDDGSLHVFGPVLMMSATARQVLEAFAALSETLLGGPSWQLWQRDERVFFGRVAASSTPEELLEAQIALTATCTIAERFWGSWVRPLIELSFAIPRPQELGPYRALADVLRFDAGMNAVSIPATLLDRVRPGRDENVGRALADFARHQLSLPDESWSERVRRALQATAKPAQLEGETLAARWGMSLRSLRRRLEAEQTTLSTLVEESLYERARLLLARPTMRLHDVAEALGYYEVSSFQRAFKRWSGVAPGAFRRHNP